MTYGPPNNQDPQQPQQPGYQQPPQQPQQPGYQQPPQQPYNPPPTAYGAGSKNSMQDINAGFKRFSLGRQLVVGGGVLALLLTFFPWYSVSANSLGVASSSVSGFGGINVLGWLVLAAVVAAMAMPLFGRRFRDMVSVPLTDGQIALFGTGAAAVIAVLFGLTLGDGDAEAALKSLGGSAGLAWGFWLALLALIASVAGGWMMYQAKE